MDNDINRVVINQQANVSSFEFDTSFDPRVLRATDLTLPNKQDCRKVAFIVKNVFSKEECEMFIAKTERLGYEKAYVNIGANKQRLIPVSCLSYYFIKEFYSMNTICLIFRIIGVV